jgi:hypothetical protein
MTGMGQKGGHLFEENPIRKLRQELTSLNQAKVDRKKLAERMAYWLVCHYGLDGDSIAEFEFSPVQPPFMSNQIKQIDPVPAYISGDVTVPDDGTIYNPDIVAPFFTAIRAGDVNLVTSPLDALLLPILPTYAPNSHVPSIMLPSQHTSTVAGNPYIVALLAQREPGLACQRTPEIGTHL